MDLEITSEFRDALDTLNQGNNLFLTGIAGSGKSTLIKYWQSTSDKKIVMLAPTGISALNLQVNGKHGQTIHSFCGLPPRMFSLNEVSETNNPIKKNLIKAVDIICIDEISMVNALILDAINIFLQKTRKSRDPFGGIQMVFIGDLYQLPPVITNRELAIYSQIYRSKYFFGADIYQEMDIRTIQLNKPFRQDDLQFVSVLNHVRTGNVNQQDLDYLNCRYINRNQRVATKLVTTNKKAAAINAQELQQLQTQEFISNAVYTGDFKESGGPAPATLALKVGAQVVFLNNAKDDWANGQVGIVTDIICDDDYPDVIKQVIVNTGGNKHCVGTNSWQTGVYNFNKQDKSIESKITGECVQFPLKLAWAITIHKSQSSTLDSVEVDMQGARFFSPGQAYVALSRVTRYENLNLTRPFNLKDFQLQNDPEIVDFLQIV